MQAVDSVSLLLSLALACDSAEEIQLNIVDVDRLNMV